MPEPTDRFSPPTPPRPARLLEALVQDTHFALRQIARSPGFSLLVVLTLAIGIGANVAIFSVLKGLILRPMVYPDPDRVVAVWETQNPEQWHQPFSTPDFIDLRDQNTVFEDIGIFSWRWLNLSSGNEPDRIFTALTTSGTLLALNVQPLFGRLLSIGDEVEGSDHVVVMSHRIWTDRFGSDPDIIGTTISLNKKSYTVVGVMREEFEWPRTWVTTFETDLWIPLVPERDDHGRGSHWVSAIARLKPGVTREQADVDLQRIASQLQELYPDSNTRTAFWIEPIMERALGGVRSSLSLLFGIVGLVLLIACANVASLLLGKSSLRRVEVAVRASLGASRRRLVRLFLTESLVLAAMGGLAGILFAFWGVGAIRSIMPANVPRIAGIGIDGPVLLFALGLILVTSLLFGLTPALTASRTDLSSTLRLGHSGRSDRKGNQLLHGLVIAQLAISLVLLNGAALLYSSHLQVLNQPQGFEPEGVLVTKIALVGEEYASNDQIVAFWDNLLTRVAVIPGVEHTAVTTKLPLQGGTNSEVLVEGEEYDPEVTRPLVEQSYISTSYFAAMGIPVLAGWTLNETDLSGDAWNIVVNREFAERYWPDGSAVGKLVRSNDEPADWTATILGVVENVRQWGMEYPAQPEMYALFPVNPWEDSNLVIRAGTDPLALYPALRQAVAEIDNQQPISQPLLYAEIIREITHRRRFLTLLVGLFTLTALLLTLSGTYGVISYYVARRRHEIGVRMTLGATVSMVLWLIIGRGMKLALLGVTFGIGGALLSTFLTQNLVFQISAINPLMLAVAIAGVVVITILASAVPAVRAIRVDPANVLKAE